MTVKTLASLGLHTRPAHGLCADCAWTGHSNCRCDLEKAELQMDRGTHVRVTLTDSSSFILEGMKGNPTRDEFISGDQVKPDGSSAWTTKVVSTRVIRKIQPLAWNSITGHLEPERDLGTGRVIKPLMQGPGDEVPKPKKITIPRNTDENP